MRPFWLLRAGFLAEIPAIGRRGSSVADRAVGPAGVVGAAGAVDGVGVGAGLERILREDRETKELIADVFCKFFTRRDGAEPIRGNHNLHLGDDLKYDDAQTEVEVLLPLSTKYLPIEVDRYTSSFRRGWFFVAACSVAYAGRMAPCSRNVARSAAVSSRRGVISCCADSAAAAPAACPAPMQVALIR